MNKTNLVMVIIVGCCVACSSSENQPIVAAAEGTVGYVGGAVSSTVKEIGTSIEGGAARVSGRINPAAARAEVDANTAQALDRLFKSHRPARALFDISYGYAVFDSRKTSFLVTLGGGGGVAVSRKDGARTYMRMFAGGVNVGAGVQFFQNIFLFETRESFDRFVNSGWEAGTSANARFGRDSLDAQVKFSNGMAFFQLSETGINLSADITGTKYWRDSELN